MTDKAESEFSFPNKIGQGYILGRDHIPCDADPCVVLYIRQTVGTDDPHLYAVHYHPEEGDSVEHSLAKAAWAIEEQVQERLKVQRIAREHRPANDAICIDYSDDEPIGFHHINVEP